MAPKPRKIRFGTNGRKTFSAQFVGACYTCGKSIFPGDKLFYASGNDAPSGDVCCGDRPDEELVVQHTNDDAIHTTDDGDPALRIAAVMPRGKTAADRCDACFMIHSPGQDACW